MSDRPVLRSSATAIEYESPDGGKVRDSLIHSAFAAPNESSWNVECSCGWSREISEREDCDAAYLSHLSYELLGEILEARSD